MALALSILGGAAWLAWAYALGYGAWARERFPPDGAFVRIPGGKAHVRSRGEGLPVLCLHGASASGREFDAAFGADAPEGFRLLLMDRPNHGWSRMRGAPRLRNQAAAAAAVLRACDAGPAIVLAHSLGCATALRLALDFPELVVGLVLVAPASHPYPGHNSWHTRLAASPVLGPLFSYGVAPLLGPLLAGGALRKTFKPASPPQNYRARAGVGLAFRGGDFHSNAREVAATKAEFAAQYLRYGEISAPAIILSADIDSVVSPALHAHALARDLPRVELINLPGAGHMPHHARPDLLRAALARITEIGATALRD